MPFDIGDKVIWESQSGGHRKTKTGEVVFVVLRGSVPSVRNFRHPQWDGITPRKHVSYVIKVQAGPQSVKHYWPRVKALRFVGEGGKA